MAVDGHGRPTVAMVWILEKKKVYIYILIEKQGIRFIFTLQNNVLKTTFLEYVPKLILIILQNTVTQRNLTTAANSIQILVIFVPPNSPGADSIIKLTRENLAKNKNKKHVYLLKERLIPS